MDAAVHRPASAKLLSAPWRRLGSHKADLPINEAGPLVEARGDALLQFVGIVAIVGAAVGTPGNNPNLEVVSGSIGGDRSSPVGVCSLFS